MWQDVLWQLQKLLSPEEALEALDSNTECFHKARAIVKILLTSKVDCTCMYIYRMYMNIHKQQMYTACHLELRCTH